MEGPLAAILEKGDQTVEHRHREDSMARTPLLCTAASGHAALVELLLGKHAD